MKLLPKSDIAKAKSVDKQREIDEGMKLAKRVDSLREVAAAEEASLKKFRSETLQAINAEITANTTKRDELTQEVHSLEERKAEALKPLTKELETIKDSLELIEVKSDLLDKWKEAIERKERELASRDELLSSRENVIHLKLQDTDRRLAESATLRDNAERQNELASETLRKAQQDSSVKIANALQREEWVKERETTAFAKEEELRKKEIDLAKEWSLLKDRQETFIRLSRK